MRNRIVKEIKEIEKKHFVKILYACESGSRAWGFPSPNSDYDVRFIYIRPLKDYLAVVNPDLQFSFPIDEDLDISGWDLKKTLQLIKKSNTTPFEWLQSPIIYEEEAGFCDELFNLCRQYYNQRSNIFHYLGVAKGALETINEANQIKIKKFFYVLRPILAAQWCKERNQIAPMTIQNLVDLLPQNLRILVKELIEYKERVEESHLISIDSDLKNFIDTTFDECSEYANELDNKSFGKELLDDFFIKKLDVKW